MHIMLMKMLKRLKIMSINAADDKSRPVKNQSIKSFKKLKDYYLCVSVILIDILIYTYSHIYIHTYRYTHKQIENMSAPIQQVQQEVSFTAQCLRCLFHSNEKSAIRYLRISNMINSALVVFAGIYSLLDISKILTLSIPYFMLGFYLACFGCLLCCFELRVGAMEQMVREHFGFMFTNLGRTFFLFFLASFCFGLVSQQQTLGIIIGVLTILNAFFNLFISYKFGLFFADPTRQYTTAEGNAAAYIKENPQLARNAVNASIGIAQQNQTQGGASSMFSSFTSRQGSTAAANDNPFGAV